MTIRKWVFPIVAVFLAGVLVGGLLVFKTKPSTIRLEVRASHKLYVYAAKGDHIYWKGQAGKHPTVTFRTGSGYPGPCIGNNAGIEDCVVNADYGSFTYDCDAGTPCIDPGVDGGSSTGFKKELLEYIKYKKEEVVEFFSGSRGEKVIPTPTERADDPEGPHTPQLTCSNGAISVSPRQIVTTTIATSKNARIQWQSNLDDGAWKVYGADLDDKVCVEKGPFNFETACTVKGGLASGTTYTYTVHANGCSDTPISNGIKIQ